MREFMDLLYQIVSKSQAFLCFYLISTTFLHNLLVFLCKPMHKISVVFSVILRYLVVKGYICLHKQSDYVTSVFSRLHAVMETT